MSQLTQFIYICFGLPHFLLTGGTIFVLFVLPFDVSKPPQSCFPAHVLFAILSISLVSSFVTMYLSVWPHAHLHIFISVTCTVTCSFFTWELVIGTVSIQYSIAGMNNHRVDLFLHMWWYSLVAQDA